MSWLQYIVGVKVNRSLLVRFVMTLIILNLRLEFFFFIQFQFPTPDGDDGKKMGGEWENNGCQ